MFRARMIKGELSQAEARVRDLRKELKEIDAGFRERLLAAGARIGTFNRKPLVALKRAHREGYVVATADWDQVEYL